MTRGKGFLIIVPSPAPSGIFLGRFEFPCPGECSRSFVVFSSSPSWHRNAREAHRSTRQRLSQNGVCLAPSPITRAAFARSRVHRGSTVPCGFLERVMVLSSVTLQANANVRRRPRGPSPTRAVRRDAAGSRRTLSCLSCSLRLRHKSAGKPFAPRRHVGRGRGASQS